MSDLVTMATIKFDRQDELDELIARIYLDTNKKFTKKDLLELIFELGIQDYHLLLDKVQNPQEKDDSNLRKKFIDTFCGVLSDEEPDSEEVRNIKSIWANEPE